MTRPVDAEVYARLAELTEIIRRTREEIAVIRPNDIHTDHIPHATDELDAVVAATEDATNKIMDVCDEITAMAATVAPEAGEKLIAFTTRIYEACNFQDITSQRIVKVVNALKNIDAKVDSILKAIGVDMNGGAAQAGAASDPDKALLNGPQLPQNAINQDDIDRILNGA